MGFRVVPKSMTLNALDGVTAVILRYFIKFSSFGANYVKVIEVPIIYAMKSSPKNVFFRNTVYDLWPYSQWLPRTSALTKGTCAISTTYIHFDAQQCYPPHARLLLAMHRQLLGTQYVLTSYAISVLRFR